MKFLIDNFYIIIIYNMKILHKGGKIIGKGGFGCVIEPPVLCKSDMDSINKVSKLINISEVSKDDYKEQLVEYDLGNFFRKHDPNFNYFLPGMDLCQINHNFISKNKKLKIDVKKCGFDRGNKTRLLNIVMKKGHDFEKITKKLNLNQIYKSLSYLINSAIFSIYNLDTLLLDLKFLNLVYSSNKPDFIHPVFIDFSPTYVVRSEDDFYQFIKKMGYITSYWILPIEINAIFYKVFKNRISEEDLNIFIREFYENHNIDLKLKKDREYIENIANFTIDKYKNDLKYIYNKIFVYQIGLSFFDVLRDTKLYKTNPQLRNIIISMITRNIIKRPFLTDITKELKKHINYQNIEDLYIYKPNQMKKIKERKKILKILKNKNIKNIKKNISNQNNTHQSNNNIISLKSDITKIVEKNINEKIKLSKQIDIKKDCFKMKLKDIKKTNEYKKLPRNIGKSKLSKKKLCDNIQKPDDKNKTIKNTKLNIKKDCFKMKLKDIKKTNEYKKLPRNIGKSKLSKKKLCDNIINN